jgi:hypothetical protein
MCMRVRTTYNCIGKLHANPRRRTPAHISNRIRDVNRREYVAEKMHQRAQLSANVIRHHTAEIIGVPKLTGSGVASLCETLDESSTISLHLSII